MHRLKLGSFVFFLLFTSCQPNASDSGSTDSKPDSVVENAEAKSPAEDANIEATKVVDPDSVKVKSFVLASIDPNEIKILTPEQRRFRYSIIDLNGDGKNEFLIFFASSYFCGSGGCTFRLLDSDGKKINDFTVSEPPIYVGAEKHNGWNDLLVTCKGKLHRMEFDGKKYPLNPSVSPEVKETPSADLRVLFRDDPNAVNQSF